MPALTRERNLTHCGHVTSFDAALPAIARTRPDLVLLDLGPHKPSRLDLIKKIRAASPSVKILILSSFDDASFAAKVIRAGGDGFVLRAEDPEEIVRAIREVLRGCLYVSEEVLESGKALPGKRFIAATKAAEPRR